jgi:hypothetical protein
MRSLSIWISIAVLAAGVQLAEAKPKGGKGKKPQTKAQQIKAHMNRATRAHKAGKFDVALTEVQAAYDLDPLRKLLFAIAQVDAKLDRCDDAIDNYEKFLKSTKDKKKQSIVKQAIAACKTKVAAAEPAPTPEPEAADKPAPGDGVFRDKKPDEPAPPPSEPVTATIGTTTAPAATETPAPPAAEPPATEPVPPAATSAPAAPIGDDAPPGVGPRPPEKITPKQPHWYEDTFGNAIVVGGIAVGVGAVLMYAGARNDLDDAESAPTIADYEQLVNEAHDRRTYSVILAGVGGALVVGGIVHYAMHGSGEHKPKSVAVTPTAGGGLVTYGGAF